MRTCRRCDGVFPLELMTRDRSKTSGYKSTCKRCESERVKAYLARVRPPRPPAWCSECGRLLEGRQRVICGASRCRDRRFARLQPAAYAKREADKVARRRERRREQRGEA